MRKALYVAVVTLALAASCAPSAWATFPGENGKIAFAREESSPPPPDVLYGRDIWTVNPDGSGERRITTEPRWDIMPDWSPDASKIAFVRVSLDGFQIWLMNSDGTEQRRLTQVTGTHFTPSWSPDGTRIAFTRYRSVGVQLFSDLFVINTDGTGERRIVGENGEFAIEPSWSPDGSRIAYVDFHDRGGTVYTVRPDGTDRQVAISIPNRVLRAPDWSPDGRQMTFAVRQEFSFYVYDIWAADADGSNARLLAEFGDVPSWSPDGTKIAFSRFRYPPPERQVWVMNADGSGQRMVTVSEDSSYTSRPDWGTAPSRDDYKNAAKFCEAEREFLDQEAFREKYGGGANAHGKCVSTK